MSDEEKKEEVKEEAKEEAKEGKVSGFFKKLGKKLDDATYDARLQGDFDTKHKKYVIYTGTSVLSRSPEISAEEHLEEGYILTLDDDEEIAAGNLIKRTETGEVMHIAAVDEAELTIVFEEKENVKKAKKITLGDKAEKVEVIKVDSEFYLK